MSAGPASTTSPTPSGLDRNEVGALLVAAGLGRPGSRPDPLLRLNGLRVSEASAPTSNGWGSNAATGRSLSIARAARWSRVPLAPRTVDREPGVVGAAIITEAPTKTQEQCGHPGGDDDGDREPIVRARSSTLAAPRGCDVTASYAAALHIDGGMLLGGATASALAVEQRSRMRRSSGQPKGRSPTRRRADRCRTRWRDRRRVAAASCRPAASSPTVVSNRMSRAIHSSSSGDDEGVPGMPHERDVGAIGELGVRLARREEHGVHGGPTMR